jgi:hypothetical protein
VDKKDNLNQIIEHIRKGTQTQDHIEQLKELIASGDTQIASQLGKYNINIGKARNIHIDNRTYMLDEEGTEALLKAIQQKISIYKQTHALKNLNLVSCVCLLFPFIFFATLSLMIPESATLFRLVVSTIGAILLTLLINIILTNISISQVIISEKINQISNFRYRIIHCLACGTVFWLLLFFLSSSHYLFYVVDNSGSMGKCPGWDGTKCPELVSEPDKFLVNKVNKELYDMFDKNKNLGREEVSSKLPLDIKVGLMEIGGKTQLNRCNTNVLAEPELNNKDKLLQGLKKIEANDNGITGIVKALKESESSINFKTIKPLQYAASKTVILYTDGYEDNCNGNKTFCEAVSELPSNFDVNSHLAPGSMNVKTTTTCKGS